MNLDVLTDSTNALSSQFVGGRVPSRLHDQLGQRLADLKDHAVADFIS
jgi:hypothetical protein